MSSVFLCKCICLLFVLSTVSIVCCLYLSTVCTCLLFVPVYCLCVYRLCVYRLYCLSFVCLPLVLVPENSLSSRDISERRAALKWINTAQMDKHCSQMSAPLPNVVQNHLKPEKKREKKIFFRRLWSLVSERRNRFLEVWYGYILAWPFYPQIWRIWTK